LKVDPTLGRIGDRLVVSEPKTDRSRRTVPLSAAVVAMLRKHRTDQKAECLGLVPWVPRAVGCS
jgi:hypothetical protein